MILQAVSRHSKEKKAKANNVQSWIKTWKKCFFANLRACLSKIKTTYFQSTGQMLMAKYQRKQILCFRTSQDILNIHFYTAPVHKDTAIILNSLRHHRRFLQISNSDNKHIIHITQHQKPESLFIFDELQTLSVFTVCVAKWQREPKTNQGEKKSIIEAVCS